MKEAVADLIWVQVSNSKKVHILYSDILDNIVHTSTVNNAYHEMMCVVSSLQ